MLGIQVVSVKRQKGKSNKTGRDYDFLTVGGLIKTADGDEFVELMLDGTAPIPERGKVYDIEMSFRPDREKRLSMYVEGLALRPAKA